LVGIYLDCRASLTNPTIGYKIAEKSNVGAKGLFIWNAKELYCDTDSTKWVDWL